MKDLDGIIPEPELEKKIYQCLNEGIKFNKLPHDLENMYLSFDEKARNKRFVLFGIVGVIFYNLFLIGDRTMLPDIFPEAVVTRVFVVTPLMILFIVGMLVKKVSGLIDFFAGNLLLLASLSIMYFLLITNHPNVDNYHTGLIVIIVVGNIVVRLRFRYAVFYSSLIFFLFVFTINNISLMNQASINNSIMVLFTIVCFTLIGNYQIENENRFTYLNILLRRIDTTKLEESNKKLKSMSISDGLTGLSNRRHFDVSLKKEWMACCRYNKPISLIFLDIDYFKNYNDNYGHLKGDECLQKIARQLATHVKRATDLVSRYGGEEFVILLPATESEGAANLAEQIRFSVEELGISHKFSQVADVVTISLGVATLRPTGDMKISELVNFADTALYKAKTQGRNKIHLHLESCRER